MNVPVVPDLTVRRTRRERTLLACAALLALVALLPACRRGASGPTGPAVTLVVENRGFFDVNVFVMRSPATRGRRLGSVTGGLSETFRVPETELQPGGLMVVQVRAIAGRTVWNSPSLAVNPGSVARLDVIATSSGSLSQSQFYLQP